MKQEVKSILHFRSKMVTYSCLKKMLQKKLKTWENFTSVRDNILLAMKDANKRKIYSFTSYCMP